MSTVACNYTLAPSHGQIRDHQCAQPQNHAGVVLTASVAQLYNHAAALTNFGPRTAPSVLQCELCQRSLMQCDKRNRSFMQGEQCQRSRYRSLCSRTKLAKQGIPYTYQATKRHEDSRIFAQLPSETWMQSICYSGNLTCSTAQHTVKSTRWVVVATCIALILPATKS